MEKASHNKGCLWNGLEVWRVGSRRGSQQEEEGKSERQTDNVWQRPNTAHSPWAEGREGTDWLCWPSQHSSRAKSSQPGKQAPAQLQTGQGQPGWVVIDRNDRK